MIGYEVWKHIIFDKTYLSMYMYVFCIYIFIIIPFMYCIDFCLNQSLYNLCSIHIEICMCIYVFIIMLPEITCYARITAHE